MSLKSDTDGIAKARVDLLFSRVRVYLLYGALLYPLFFLADWRERPWDRPAALLIRLATTAVIMGIAALCWTHWGRPRALMLASVCFLVAHAGFAIGVWHSKGFGASNNDAFELFFGAFCVVIPATTGQATLVGVIMAGIQFSAYILSGTKPDYVDLAWNMIPFSIIFLSGRHIANLLEVAWRQEFVERAALQTSLDEHRKTRDQLVQSEKMAALGRLTAGVAHELNNPLYVMSTNVDLIEGAVAALNQSGDEDTAPRKLRDGVRRLRVALDRTAAVSALLRQFSTPPSRTVVPSDINSLLESSLSLVAMTAKQKEVAIQTNLAPLSPLHCDPQSLIQVFVNLIENACDAVSDQGHVWIDTKMADPHSIVVTIEDDGVGISPEDLTRLGEPFFTTKEPGKGMGLGLAVSMGIVRDLGGTLVFSSPGRGAKACVSLPLRFPAA
jgi:two-component system, NtrC family, sensor kinase